MAKTNDRVLKEGLDTSRLNDVFSIAHAVCLCTRSCDTMYRVRESKSKLKLFYRLFMDLFCHISLAPGLNTCLKAGFLASILTPGRQPNS